jgi:hypothetical protein
MNSRNVDFIFELQSFFCTFFIFKWSIINNRKKDKKSIIIVMIILYNVRVRLTLKSRLLSYILLTMRKTVGVGNKISFS